MIIEQFQERILCKCVYKRGTSCPLRYQSCDSLLSKCYREAPLFHSWYTDNVLVWQHFLYPAEKGRDYFKNSEEQPQFPMVLLQMEICRRIEVRNFLHSSAILSCVNSPNVLLLMIGKGMVWDFQTAVLPKIYTWEAMKSCNWNLWK